LENVTEENINAYRVLVEEVRERNHLEDIGVDGRIKTVPKDVEWINLAWYRDRCNETLGSVKCDEFLYW
jgi:hypothetical protein